MNFLIVHKKSLTLGALVVLLSVLLFLNVFVFKNYSSEKAGIFSFLITATFLLFFALRTYEYRYAQKRADILIREIADVYERLNILERQKTEFISIASHQLRTPLTVIKGYASMILEGSFGEVGASVRVAMEKLYASSKKIVSLVDDLLAVSRIEEGRMALTFTRVNFIEFVQKTLKEAEDRIKAAGLELSFSAEEEGKDVFVDMDEKKIMSIIAHIFDNAIEFTRAPGTVRVAVFVDTIAKKIRLAISDTGIGMTAEQIKALFERFDLKISVSGAITARAEKAALAQEKSPTRKNAAGIGIYVAKEIIHAHHGYFMAESEGVNRGTTFIIELPIATGAR